MANDRERAEQDLRVIRSLMERATIYRAISAPTALCGAVLAIGAALFISKIEPRPRSFAVFWLIILVLVLAANTLFVWREATRAGRPFFSASMNMAIRAVTPCLIIPAALTIWYLTTGYLGAQELLLVAIWIAFYGVALLSTSLFAPRSLVVLGWCFLISALAIPVVASNAPEEISALELPNILMGVTFGGYHLIYALCTWRRKGAEESPDA
jgi:hypothetical protein